MNYNATANTANASKEVTFCCDGEENLCLRTSENARAFWVKSC